MQMQRVEMEEMRQRDANRTALNALQGPKKKPKLDLSAMDDVSAFLLYFLVLLRTRTDKKLIYFGEFLTDITSFTILHATILWFSQWHKPLCGSKPKNEVMLAKFGALGKMSIFANTKFCFNLKKW